MGGRELAARLEEEYAGTVRSGRPSHVEAMERIRQGSMFRQAHWQGHIKKITQNNKGQMEILFIVSYEQRAEVLELINAYGMPLDIYVKLFGELPPEGFDNEEDYAGWRTGTDSD